MYSLTKSYPTDQEVCWRGRPTRCHQLTTALGPKQISWILWIYAHQNDHFIQGMSCGDHRHMKDRTYEPLLRWAIIGYHPSVLRKNKFSSFSFDRFTTNMTDTQENFLRHLQTHLTLKQTLNPTMLHAYLPTTPTAARQSFWRQRILPWLHDCKSDRSDYQGCIFNPRQRFYTRKVKSPNNRLFKQLMTIFPLSLSFVANSFFLAFEENFWTLKQRKNKRFRRSMTVFYYYFFFLAFSFLEPFHWRKSLKHVFTTSTLSQRKGRAPQPSIT